VLWRARIWGTAKWLYKHEANNQRIDEICPVWSDSVFATMGSYFRAMRGRRVVRPRRPGSKGELRRAAGSAVGVALLLLAPLTMFGALADASGAISVPTVSTPAVSVPTVTVPPVTVPTVSVPTISAPTPTVSNAIVPTVTVPPVKSPPVSLPSVTTPSVSTPPIRVPTVTDHTPSTSAVPAGTGSGPSPRSALPDGTSPASSSSATRPAETTARTTGYSSAVASTRDSTRAAEPRGHRRSLTRQQLAKLVSNLRGCLSAITPRQKKVLVLLTGLGRRRSYPARQAAQILRVSLTRELRIEQAAIAELKRASRLTDCAASDWISRINQVLARTPFALIPLEMLGSGRPSHRPRASVAAPRSHKRGATSSRGVPSAGSSSPSKSAVISPPHQGGTWWLLLVVAIALLVPLVGTLLVRNRDHAQFADGGAFGWMGRVGAPPVRLWRPYLPRLSALLGLLTLPLRTPRETSKHGPEEPASALGADIMAGTALGMFELGKALEEKGDLARASESYRSADAMGHPDAAFHLGGISAEEGDFSRALEWYRRADELGHAAGAFNLGVLLEHQNDRPRAEAAYRRADDRGDPGAGYALGVLLQRSGDRGRAEAAFGRADERGDAAAAFDLGVLLAERGELAEAEAAFCRADERGHVAGAFNLGVLLEERGDLVGAEAAYLRAEERGHGEVADLAHTALLELRGQR